MAARNLILAIALGFGGVACAGNTHEAQAPEAPPVAPARAPQVAADPPPAVPPTLIAQPTQGGDAPAPAAPAPTLKDDDDLAKIGPNQADLEAQARDNAAAAAKDKAKWAKAARDADKKGTEDWSRDRVQKATARVSQLQLQSSKIPPNKRGRYNTDMAAFSSRKAEAISRINSLSATGTEVWKSVKAELDRAIEEMDAALGRLEADF